MNNKTEICANCGINKALALSMQFAKFNCTVENQFTGWYWGGYSYLRVCGACFDGIDHNTGELNRKLVHFDLNEDKQEHRVLVLQPFTKAFVQKNKIPKKVFNKPE
jgi:hypothetical protein